MWLIVLFWVLLGLAIHPYVTYPVVILFWSILRPKRVIRGSITPPVSVVVAVFNEEGSIAERIEKRRVLSLGSHGGSEVARAEAGHEAHVCDVDLASGKLGHQVDGEVGP